MYSKMPTEFFFQALDGQLQVQLTRVLQIIKLIQAFMGVLVTCNDPISKQTYLKVLIFFQPLFEGNFTLTPEWVTNTKLP